MVSKLKTIQVAPRKISAFLCQVAVAAMISLNLSSGAVAKFAVWQKCD